LAISLRIQSKVGKQLKDFLPELENDEEIKEVAKQVKEFSKNFPMPGL